MGCKVLGFCVCATGLRNSPSFAFRALFSDDRDRADSNKQTAIVPAAMQPVETRGVWPSKEEVLTGRSHLSSGQISADYSTIAGSLDKERL
jgi:hypothetical protein